MGYSASAHLIVGVMLDQVKKVITTQKEEPRFDPKTGKPIKPEIIKTSVTTLFGREVNAKNGPEDWLYELKIEGLSVSTPDCEGDYSKSVIGIRVKVDPQSLKTINPTKVDINEMVSRYVSVMKKIYFDTSEIPQPNLYLMCCESY